MFMCVLSLVTACGCGEKREERASTEEEKGPSIMIPLAECQPASSYDAVSTARVLTRHTLVDSPYDVVRIAHPPSHSPFGPEEPTIYYRDALLLHASRIECAPGDTVRLRIVDLLNFTLAPARDPEHVYRFIGDKRAHIYIVIGVEKEKTK
jgi:hypothetical protein